MQVIHFPLVRTGQLHALAEAYLDHSEEVRDLYQFSPDLQGALEALEKRKNFTVNRELLADTLKAQYLEMQLGFFEKAENQQTSANIDLLLKNNTFTVTTGHQLSIFTGPLYFVYKILSVIQYAKILKDKYPDYNFVPVYWMASEDHDFEEISTINLFSRQLKWEQTQGGAVGRMNPASLTGLIDQLEELISRQEEGKYLLSVFKVAYLSQPTLVLATRSFVHELFKNEGLVILDADNKDLKQTLIPVFENDIFNNQSHKIVNTTLGKLDNKFHPPVQPREINVFYLTENNRQRIIKEGDAYKVLNSNITWTASELKAEINANPENFSPNVVLRPVYQEMILPNIAYIGGNNEIAYWLELKAAFDVQNVFFPQLLIRDSALWIGKRFAKDLVLAKLEPEDLFAPLKDVKALFYDRNELKTPPEEEIELLIMHHETLKQKAQSLPPDIAATLVKQSNQHIKELKKSIGDIRSKVKEQHAKTLEKIDKIYETVFPNGSFQERYDNLIPFYLQYGPEFFKLLKDNFNPTEGTLKIFVDI